MATRRRGPHPVIAIGDAFEQVTGRYAGRVIEIDEALGLKPSAGRHIKRVGGPASLRSRRTYFRVTVLSPDHLAGHAFRVSEKTLAGKYSRLPNGSIRARIAEQEHTS